MTRIDSGNNAIVSMVTGDRRCTNAGKLHLDILISISIIVCLWKRAHILRRYFDHVKFQLGVAYMYLYAELSLF